MSLRISVASCIDDADHRRVGPERDVRARDVARADFVLRRAGGWRVARRHNTCDLPEQHFDIVLFVAWTDLQPLSLDDGCDIHGKAVRGGQRLSVGHPNGEHDDVTMEGLSDLPANVIVWIVYP